LVAEAHDVFVKVLVTNVWLVSQSDQTWPRESVDEGRQEVIQLVDEVVTVFPPLRVPFAWSTLSEGLPPVANANNDAFKAAFEDVVEFDSVTPVGSNSKGAVNAASEDVSGFEGVALVTGESKGTSEVSIAVFTLFDVLFA
jgi:hypothetical protein